MNYSKLQIRILLICLMLMFSGCYNNNSTISAQYINAVQAFKTTLKDPASLRIYGDAVVMTAMDGELKILSLEYDAKNSYGGYTGRSFVNIHIGDGDDELLFIDEDDKHYIDVRDIIQTTQNVSEMLDDPSLDTEKRDQLQKQLDLLETESEIISGKALANKVGAEYYD